MSRLKGLVAQLRQLSYHTQQVEQLARVASCQLRSPALLQARRPYSSTVEEARKQAVANHLLVDTLELSNAFEKTGLTRETAQQLARDISALIIDNKMKMEGTFVKQVALEKTIMEQESKIQSFKNELSKAQDMHQANVNKDMERQQSYLDRMKGEVRHEIDKLSASQRLDMNLEKGRMRDDLQTIRDKSTDLQIQMDRDINELRSSVEKAKNDTIKSVITILGTFSAIAFTISRFVQMSSGGG